MEFDRRGVLEGMHVYSSDGQRVGKVVRCGQSAFEIEKGFFFPKDYLINYSDVTRTTGDDIYLALSKDQLREMWERTELVGDSATSASGIGQGNSSATTGDLRPGVTSTSGYGPDQGRFANTGGASVSRGDISEMGSTSRTDTLRAGKEGELRVPVVEEKLEVGKRSREAGEVRVHKEVKTEMKTVSVPVTREEVKVERVPVSGERLARPGEASFQESTISVPVREEEVEIRKRPVVKEEVRISKEQRTEQKQVSEQVRHEEVEVENESERRAPYPNEPGYHAGGTLDEPVRTGVSDDTIGGRNIDRTMGGQLTNDVDEDLEHNKTTPLGPTDDKFKF